MLIMDIKEFRRNVVHTVPVYNRAKLGAFLKTKGFKSIVDVPEENRETFLAELKNYLTANKN